MIKKRVCADEVLFKSLADFMKTEAIQMELTQDGGADVNILMSDTRKESDLQTLYAGGHIPCRIALELAQKLQIPTIQTGALLNYLDIKVKNCSLGCF
jgi:hypothetical protein